MIILDTSVVSSLMTPPPPEVVTWLNAQESWDLHITTVTIGEIGYGLRTLPKGARRSKLESRFEQFVDAGFQSRILSFDESAARLYGDVRGRRMELGRPMGVADGQIAAIARAHGFAIATRNVRDFEHCDIALINPFASAVH